MFSSGRERITETLVYKIIPDISFDDKKHTIFESRVGSWLRPSINCWYIREQSIPLSTNNAKVNYPFVEVISELINFLCTKVNIILLGPKKIYIVPLNTIISQNRGNALNVLTQETAANISGIHKYPYRFYQWYFDVCQNIENKYKCVRK